MPLIKEPTRLRASEYQKWDYIVSEHTQKPIARPSDLHTDTVGLQSTLLLDSSDIYMALGHGHHCGGGLCRWYADLSALIKD